MTADSAGDGLAAALIQICAHAEQIGGLDARETGHYQQVAAQLRELAAEAASASTRIDGIGGTLARQAAIIDALDGLDGQVAALARQLAELKANGEATSRACRPTCRSRRRGGGSSPPPSARQQPTACAPGSTRSTGPATASWPPRSRPAGNTTRSACTHSTGSVNYGPSSILTTAAPAAASPPRANGKPVCSPQPPSRWLTRPPAASTPPRPGTSLPGPLSPPRNGTRSGP